MRMTPVPVALPSSYFVPEELTIRALVAAARRGVRIITPGQEGEIFENDWKRARPGNNVPSRKN